MIHNTIYLFRFLTKIYASEVLYKAFSCISNYCMKLNSNFQIEHHSDSVKYLRFIHTINSENSELYNKKDKIFY